MTETNEFLHGNGVSAELDILKDIQTRVQFLYMELQTIKSQLA